MRAILGGLIERQRGRVNYLYRRAYIGVYAAMTATPIPLLGLGTYPLSGAEAQHSVINALEVGFRHIDTAQMYGNEKDVGQALKASGVARDELFIVTKVDPGNLGASRFRSSVEKSIADLGGPVDLLLIHWPPPEVEVDATVARLMEASEAGFARQIGVSNFPPGLMRRAQQFSGGALICNQVEFHPLIDQSRLLAAAKRLNMVLTAYCPLARGAALQEPAVQRVAQKHGRSASEVVLRWIIQQGVAAIPMTTRRENAASNLRALSFELPEEDMAEISALTRQNRRLISPASMTGRWDS